MIKQCLFGLTIAVTLTACGGKGGNVSKKEESGVKLETNNSAMNLLIGTYTSGESKSDGIYVYQFNIQTGDAEKRSNIKVANPSYLAISDNEKYVYAVSENGDGTDAANAFSFDRKSGELELLNSQPTKGDAPCYVVVDKSGNKVLTANYSGGNISIFSTDTLGRLNPIEKTIKFFGKGLHKERQTQAHLHCVVYSPH